jgi:hypothetical protein
MLASPESGVIAHETSKSHQIHAEIRAAQTSPVESGTVQLGSAPTAWLTQIFMLLPQFLRNLGMG